MYSFVVKALNSILHSHLRNLTRPVGAADRTYLPIAGDNEPAKVAVAGFLNDIGYGTVDGGSLADGWRQQYGTPVCGGVYGPSANEKGRPAGADMIRAALAAATR